MSAAQMAESNRMFITDARGGDTYPKCTDQSWAGGPHNKPWTA